MQWDESLESKIPVIDHEHKELVTQLASLMDESRPDRVREMLSFLKEYVIQHFAHEQLLHRSARYPKAHEHKIAHIDFISTFGDMEERFVAEGETPELAWAVGEAVTDWLKRHIMGEDREFAEYYNRLDPRKRGEEQG